MKFGETGLYLGFEPLGLKRFWNLLTATWTSSGLAFCVTMEASVLEPIGLSIDQFGFEPKTGKWVFRVFGLSLERDYGFRIVFWKWRRVVGMDEL